MRPGARLVAWSTQGRLAAGPRPCPTNCAVVAGCCCPAAVLPCSSAAHLRGAHCYRYITCCIQTPACPASETAPSTGVYSDAERWATSYNSDTREDPRVHRIHSWQREKSTRVGDGAGRAFLSSGSAALPAPAPAAARAWSARSAPSACGVRRRVRAASAASAVCSGAGGGRRAAAGPGRRARSSACTRAASARSDPRRPGGPCGTAWARPAASTASSCPPHSPLVVPLAEAAPVAPDEGVGRREAKPDLKRAAGEAHGGEFKLLMALGRRAAG